MLVAESQRDHVRNARTNVESTPERHSVVISLVIVFGNVSKLLKEGIEAENVAVIHDQRNGNS